MKKILIILFIFFTSSCQLFTEEISVIEDAEELHYVSLGDSTVFWSGMNSMYAEMIEEDLGVTVVLHNWAHGSGGSKRMLEELETNNQLRADLQSADIITIQIPTHAWGNPMRAYTRNPESCGGDDHQACLRNTLKDEKDHIEKIFGLIVELADPTKTLIRAQDTYLFAVGEMKESGTFEMLNDYWRQEQKYIHHVASRYGIPVAEVYDHFMGPEWNQDPAEHGLMLDKTHTNERGSRLMADLIRDLGYEYAPRIGK